MNSLGARQRLPARVLCVGASRLQTSLLASALACHPEVEDVGSAADLNVALQQAPSAEIVVLHAANLGDGGPAWVWAITDAHPQVHVVALGVPRNEALVVAYVEAGAMGCVTEEQDLGQLLEAIRAVHCRQGYLAPELVPALLHRLAPLRRAIIDPQAAARRLEALTPREHEILGMLSQGCSNGVIANRLRIAVGTVKNHVHSILQKLHASGRWEAAACLEIAGRSGYLDQTWPLAWAPWPATEEAELPVRAAPVLFQGVRFGDPAAVEGPSEIWDAPWSAS